MWDLVVLAWVCLPVSGCFSSCGCCCIRDISWFEVGLVGDYCGLASLGFGG